MGLHLKKCLETTLVQIATAWLLCGIVSGESYQPHSQSWLLVKGIMTSVQHSTLLGTKVLEGVKSSPEFAIRGRGPVHYPIGESDKEDSRMSRVLLMAVPCLWNALPGEIRQAPTLVTITWILKTFYLPRPFRGSFMIHFCIESINRRRLMLFWFLTFIMIHIFMPLVVLGSLLGGRTDYKFDEVKLHFIPS